MHASPPPAQHCRFRTGLAVSLACLILAGSALEMVGCRPRPPRRPLHDRDPVFVIPATRVAADADRVEDAPRLIELLESEDAAIRWAAIRSLQRITGQDLGFVYWHNESRRREAVDRWKHWAVARGMMSPEDAPPLPPPLPSAPETPEEPGDG